MIRRTFRYLLMLNVATVMYAQSDTRPSFEVASVKANDPTNAQASYMPALDARAGGTLRISNRRLDEIIMVAYGIAGSQISGPRWLTELTTDSSQECRVDLRAKLPYPARREHTAVRLQAP